MQPFVPERMDGEACMHACVLLAEANLALVVEIGLARRDAYSMQVYSFQCCKVPHSERAGC